MQDVKFYKLYYKWFYMIDLINRNNLKKLLSGKLDKICVCLIGNECLLNLM